MPKLKSSGSITVDAANSTLVFGGQVAYHTTLPSLPAGARPDVLVTVMQGTVVGERNYASAFPHGWAGPAPLGPTPSWFSGPGQGRLDLGYWTQDGKWTALGSTSFSVAA